MNRDLIKNNPESVTDEEIKALVEADAEKGMEDLYHFNKNILDYQDMDEEVHGPLCDFLYGGKRQKLIMMPRGTFKSTLTTIGFGLHNVVLDGNIRILIASEKLSNAQKFLNEIKGHIEGNEYFRLCYGELDKNKKDDTWNNSEIIVATRNKNMKEPTISTAGIDVTKVGMHYDLIIVDDPVSSSNVTSRDQIEKTLDWYKLLLSLLEPTGRLVVIGTRWDYGDLYGTLQEPPFKDLFDFYIKKAEWVDEETGQIKYLFPARLTREFLEQQKIIQGTYIYSCQYQNDPVPTENATFKPEWFKYYIDDDLRRKNLNIFITVDPAISLENAADFTVFVVCGIDEFNNMYVLQIVREKMLPKDIVDKLFDLQRTWNATSVGIETIAFQKTLKYQIQDEMRQQSFFFSLVELKHQDKAKEARIRGLQPRYENGTIFHKKGDIMNEELEHELLRFPKAKHDDVSDCLASQLEILQLPMRRKTEGEKKKKKFRNRIARW